MKKYVLSENQYIKLRNVLLETSLRTYIFDWDDNILYMPTTIKMDKKEGHYFSINHYNHIIKENCDAYRVDNDGNLHLLLKFRKNVILCLF